MTHSSIIQYRLDPITCGAWLIHVSAFERCMYVTASNLLLCVCGVPLSLPLSLCLCLFLCVPLWVFLSLCVSPCPSISLYLSPVTLRAFPCLSVPLCLSVSLCVPLCLYVSLCFPLCLSVYLYVCGGGDTVFTRWMISSWIVSPLLPFPPKPNDKIFHLFILYHDELPTPFATRGFGAQWLSREKWGKVQKLGGYTQ